MQVAGLTLFAAGWMQAVEAVERVLQVVFADRAMMLPSLFAMDVQVSELVGVYGFVQKASGPPVQMVAPTVGATPLHASDGLSDLSLVMVRPA